MFSAIDQKRNTIANLITSDLQRKNDTKRRGQTLGLIAERDKVVGRKDVATLQQDSATKRESMAQEGNTLRQNIIANTNKIVQGMRDKTDLAVQDSKAATSLSVNSARNETMKNLQVMKGEQSQDDIRLSGEENRWYQTETYNYDSNALNNVPVIDTRPFQPQIATPTTDKKKKNNYEDDYLTIPDM